jgi:type I restriction enzyme S subunit
MFLLLKGELENRLDPLFYSENIFSFLKTTTFEVKKIREINTFVKAGFGVGRQDQDLEQNGYIQIRPTNLDEDGFLKFDKNIYLSESYLETNKANILEKEDVLFNNTNSQELGLNGNNWGEA